MSKMLTIIITASSTSDLFIVSQYRIWNISSGPHLATPRILRAVHFASSFKVSDKEMELLLLVRRSSVSLSSRLISGRGTEAFSSVRSQRWQVTCCNSLCRWHRHFAYLYGQRRGDCSGSQRHSSKYPQLGRVTNGITRGFQTGQVLLPSDSFQMEERRVEIYSIVTN